MLTLEAPFLVTTQISWKTGEKVKKCSAGDLIDHKSVYRLSKTCRLGCLCEGVVFDMTMQPGGCMLAAAETAVRDRIQQPEHPRRIAQTLGRPFAIV